MASAVALGLLGGLPLWVKQRLGIRKIRLLRERFLVRLGRRLEEQCQASAIELSGEIAHRLVLVLQAQAGRLAAFAGELLDLRSSLERAVALRDNFPLSSTRFSCALPSSADVPTDDLVRRFPLPKHFDAGRALGALLIKGDLHVDVDEVLPDLRALVLPLVSNALWPDLAAVLRDAPLSADRVARLLATETAPIVRRQELGQRDYVLARLLCAPEPLIAQLESQGALDDVPSDAHPPGRDPNFISLISFVDVQSLLVGQTKPPA